MNQQKIGAFLKELRCGKKMTQEQLAEHLGVSNRTVSRWETGFNMPDLALVIELAAFYEVEIPEILNGERKIDITRCDIDGAARKIAEYSSRETQNLTRKMHGFSLVGVAAMLLYFLLLFAGATETALHSFAAGLMPGIAFGTILLSALYTSKYLFKIRACKLRVLRRWKNK